MPVIDHHDDLCESFISAVDPQELAGIMKISSWKESADLLDRDFALIMVDDEGREHRKFACFDAGNALMSEWYLLNAEHHLPEEAVKTAAANIADSMEHFGLSPSMETMYLADRDPDVDSRRVKVAYTDPASYTANSTTARPRSMAAKGAIGGAIAGGATGATSGGSFKSRATKAVGGALLGGSVGGAGGKVLETGMKTASAPTSPFDYVATAVGVWDDLDPYDRHDLAVDLVKTASTVGASVPDHIFAYSGTELNPMFSKIAEARIHFARDPEVARSYARLSKMAGAMDPEDVVEAMYLLDEQAQLNHRYGSRIPDPVLSVYGTTKEAEYSWSSGSDYVTEGMLKRYAGSMASNRMDEIFSEDLKDLFRRDPVTVFKKMPEEQQVLVARLASQSRDTNNGGY